MPNMDTASSLLQLPLETRLHIWALLLTPVDPLVIRCLFIRAHYRSIFMTQQPKAICTTVLRVCKQITHEALPVLYGRPEWRAACRVEALASQISIANFSLIKHMCVDVDDLPSIVGSLLLDMQESDPDHRMGTSSSVELKLELESRALLENMISSSPSSPQPQALPAGMVSPWTPMQRRLKFANLEVLQVEGYQAMALTSRGSRKARLEGLRLCKFAKEILAYHPSLASLVQQDTVGNGGSDAVDMGMARVRWRFLRHQRSKAVNEHVVDVVALEEMLRAMVEIDERDALARDRGHDFPVWGQGGTFQQYPYLHPPLLGARVL